MLRRCFASMLLPLSAVAMLAVQPTSAHAAALTNFGYYELVNNRSTPLNSLLVANVIPPNTITPPNASTSPLTILDGSFGFDPKNLQVFLSPADPNVQGIAINFANGGLAPGGTLNFKVSLDSAVNPDSPPRLELQTPDTDLMLVSMPPPTADPIVVSPPSLPVTPVDPPVTAPVPPTVENTPEPVSIALWSALAGVGFLRARSFRRASLAVKV